MKRVLASFCIAFVLAALAGPAWAVPSAGQPAPPLKGTLVTGEQFDLATVVKDKVVVLFFWQHT